MPLQGPEELDALDRGIAALEQRRNELGDDVVDTALRPLLERRRRLVASGERRKLVTVLVADLVGSTPLTEALGAEAMREVIGRYFGHWREAVHEQGGEVEKFIGDAVVGVFGMGQAREDDPHRAVRAAVSVRPALARLADEVRARHGQVMSTRVGIDTGEVVLGRFDEWGDGDLVVVGGAANVAARLQTAAPPDGILLSAATARHVRGSFGLQDHGELELRGVDRPVRTFLVHSAAGSGFWSTSRGLEGVSTRTVGREAELARLTALFEDTVAERRSAVVTVVGDAGLGKTRLLADLESWLAGLPDPAWLLRGRAEPAHEGSPHAVLRSAFADRFGIRDTDPPDQVLAAWRRGMAAMAAGSVEGTEDVAAWLGFPVAEEGAAGRDVDPAALQRRARVALEAAVQAMCREAPVVLLLEDLHWADRPLLDLLTDLQARPRPFPLLVVATTRPALLEEHPHWGEGLPGHHELRLRPLSGRDTARLVEEVLQRADEVPDWVRTLVVDTAEGNPFFVEEVLAWLVDVGAVRTTADRWTVSPTPVRPGTVPGTLRALLQARLDAVPPPERDLVDRASVVGRVFWDAAVDHLGTGSAAAPAEAYDELRRREVVHQRPTSAFADAREFAFRHVLLRDVAYEGLLTPHRRRFHARAADWLARTALESGRPDEHAGAVAHHLVAAGEDARAVPWLLRAGRHAAATYANDDALDLLRRADRLADEDDLVFEVLVEQERVLDRTGRREEQRAVLDRLTSLSADDPARCARVLVARGRWFFFHAQYAEAASVGQEAARLAREVGAADTEVEAGLVVGRSRAFAADHGGARASLESTLALARDRGTPRQVAEALRLLGVVATNLHEEQAAVELLEESALWFRRAGDDEGKGLVDGQLGAVLMLSGRMEEARARSEEALAVFVASGHVLRQGIVMGNLTSVALDTGRLDEGLTSARRTLELTESVEDPEGVVSSLQRLGEAERLTGSPDEARAHLERAVELGVEHGLHYFVAHAHASLCSLELDRVLVSGGSAAGAVAQAQAAVQAAGLSEVPAAQAMCAYALGLATLAGGDGDGAVEALVETRDRMRELGLRAETVEAGAVLAEALLLAGRAEDARAAARRAVVALGPDGPEPRGESHPGRGLLACHRVLTALGDPWADQVTSTVARFLARRAAVIEDPEVRGRFLAIPDCVALARVAGAAAMP